MAQRIVLVRHAKTEARREGLDDERRELTKAGLRSCEAKLPRAMALVDWPAGESLQVWSSPARRALQTAEVAARALGVDEVEVHDSLYADDADAFLLEAKAVPGTVVAVGHDPFVEELCRSLTGATLSFGKCAAAEISFEEADSDDGADAGVVPQLEWFVQGPDHRRWKTLVEVERVMKRAWKRIRENRAAFLSDPVDPETLHQYRISLRVARSLVQFLAPLLKAKRARGAEDACKLLARETSRLRELDVFAEEIAARQDRGIDDGRVALEVELARNQARAGLMASVQSERGEKLLRRVKRLCEDVPWKRSVEAEGLSPDTLAAHFAALSAECQSDLAACDFADAEETHDLRKRSKRLRYAARELSALLGEEAAGAGAGAKELQERLGEVCDARVNAGLAAEFGDGALEAEQRELARSLVAGLQPTA